MAETTGTVPGETGTTPPPAAQPPPVVTGPELGSLWQSDDLKGSKSLERYKSVDDLGKAYVEMERKMGEMTQATAIPKGDAPPEAWQAFWQQLPGYPKTPDAYNVAPPELPPEAGSWDPGFVQQFLGDVAHKQGMTTGQVQAVFDFYAQYMQAVVQAQRDLDATQIHDGYEALRKDWTVNTDANLKRAETYLERTFGTDDPWWETIIKRQDGKTIPLKNIPGFIKMSHQLYRLTMPDELVLGDGSDGYVSADGAQARLDEAYAKHLRKEITTDELNAAIRTYQPIASSRQRTAGR